MNNFQKGSEWRRWDLHLHTPNTKLSTDYGHDATVWDRYIENLESSPVEAFGITDYFSADGYYALLEKYLEKYPDRVHLNKRHQSPIGFFSTPQLTWL